jgi:hypothetical protein
LPGGPRSSSPLVRGRRPRPPPRNSSMEPRWAQSRRLDAHRHIACGP